MQGTAVAQESDRRLAGAVAGPQSIPLIGPRAAAASHVTMVWPKLQLESSCLDSILRREAG